MKAAQLLEHFDRLSEAPGAVPRLRRFILDLTVRGKLVEQDAGDEPAAELLKKIRAYGPKSLASKKSSPPTNVPDSQVDQPFAIPESWMWTRLCDLGRTQTGATPSKNAGEVYGNHIPFVKPGDLLPSHVDYFGEGLSELGLKDSRRFTPAGSLLMVCIGTIGKCQLVDRTCSFNQQINSIAPYDGLESRYLLGVFMSEFFQNAAWTASAKTTIAILNKGKWEQLSVPLPPHAEQHRIVAKVDELMALCDQLEAAQQEREHRRDHLASASLQRLNQPAADTHSETQRDHARFHLHQLPRLTTRPEHIKALRQTILNLAVRGLLVLQDANDEPATELLKRIQTEKTRLTKLGCIKAEKAAEPIDQTGWIVPGGWALCRWNRIAMKIGDIDHKMPDTVSGGVPYVSPRDFYPNNVIDFEGAKRISREDYLRLAAKIKPDLDDLIYPRYGTIGENRLVTEQREFLASYSCAVVKTLTGFIDPKYQYIFSISGYCKDQAKAAENKTTQANVGIASIQQYIVPLPPLAEQHRIVAKVDALMELCDQFEAQLATTQTDSRHLLEAVLEAALMPA